MKQKPFLSPSNGSFDKYSEKDFLNLNGKFSHLIHNGRKSTFRKANTLNFTSSGRSMNGNGNANEHLTII